MASLLVQRSLGSTPIMAAFTHLNRESLYERNVWRFLCRRTIETAITEHATIVFASCRQPVTPSQEIDMRVYVADLDADLHDIRAMRESHAAYYHPINYAVSQEFAEAPGKRFRGIVYASVPDDGDECAAMFRAWLLSNCR
jgi:hypothetical protein